ncbi:MAG: hypothetical protein CW335_03630, partial [Clostridiales bacterium]|nr:hypothetical protein [Clostridiales bacterium]
MTGTEILTIASSKRVKKRIRTELCTALCNIISFFNCIGLHFAAFRDKIYRNKYRGKESAMYSNAYV